MLAAGSVSTAMSTAESTDLWTTFHSAALSPGSRLSRVASDERPESKPPAFVLSALFDAVGELGHLVEELAVLAHLRVDLLHRVHDGGVVAAPEAGSDLRQ